MSIDKNVFQDGVLTLIEDSGDLLNILFSGDLCPRGLPVESEFGQACERRLADLLPELRGNDLSIVNLEAPLTRSGQPITKSGPNLKIDPSWVELISRGGWDVACCANNHIGDFGPAAVMETLDLLEGNRISQVGAGQDLGAARKPLVVERQGLKIALLGLAENEFGIAGDNSAGANPLQPMRNISQIRELSTEADITIVMVHGGNEYNPVPSPRVVDTYRAFADAGAAAVIAGHTHCPQGFELWKGVPIVYSLSNFLFPKVMERDPVGYNWWYGYMVRLGFSAGRPARLQVIPHYCGPRGDRVVQLRGREKADFLDYLVYVSNIIEQEKEVAKYHDAWCMSRLNAIVSLAGKPFFPVDWNDADAVSLLMARRNLNTCEAHNELQTGILRILAEARTGAADEYSERLAILSAGKLPGF